MADADPEEGGENSHFRITLVITALLIRRQREFFLPLGSQGHVSVFAGVLALSLGRKKSLLSLYYFPWLLVSEQDVTQD